jgi:hypothetical protein
MDFIVKLSDTIADFEGLVEVMQISQRFDGKVNSIEDLVKIENRLVNGIFKMTLEQFMGAISESSDGDESITTPLLPRNCIKHVWKKRTAGEQEVFIEIPKNRWDIKYHTQNFDQVGFPRMIFKYTVAKDTAKLSRIVALKESGQIREDTPLFQFPFSNVDGSSSNVCMGSNILPGIESISQLSTYHSIFFAAPFGDSYGAKTSTNKGLRELFTMLSDSDFNDEYLIPTKKTLKTI